MILPVQAPHDASRDEKPKVFVRSHIVLLDKDEPRPHLCLLGVVRCEDLDQDQLTDPTTGTGKRRHSRLVCMEDFQLKTRVLGASRTVSTSLTTLSFLFRLPDALNSPDSTLPM